nr:MAG TPA: hypothetical protein [Caudoviricetes sp.]
MNVFYGVGEPARAVFVVIDRGGIRRFLAF